VTSTSWIEERPAALSSEGLSPAELEDECVVELPDREAMSVTIPFGGHIFAHVLSKISAGLEQAVHDASTERALE
jgi:hypothetical protein